MSVFVAVFLAVLLAFLIASFVSIYLLNRTLGHIIHNPHPPDIAAAEQQMMRLFDSMGEIPVTGKTYEVETIKDIPGVVKPDTHITPEDFTDLEGDAQP
jgi:hypothetical protein